MKMNALSTASAAIFLIMATATAAPPFQLIDKKGREITMAISGVGKKAVSGTVNDKKTKVPLTKLDPANLKALESFATEHGLLDIYPELSVSVTVRDSTPRKEGSSFMRHNIMTPELTLQGPRTEAIPALNATILTICAETKALFVHKKKVYNVKGKNTVKIPAADSGAPRKFRFEPIRVKFDDDEDHTNTGGWIFKYWFSSLTDPTSGQLIRWDTNYVTLRKYLNKHPEEIPKFVSKNVEDKIPSKY